MKSVSIALLTAAVSVAAAQPHMNHHRHQHLHKRDTDVVWKAGPTVVAYVLNGQPISEQEVKEGIANGTLVWSHGGIKEVEDVSPAAPKATHAVHTQAAAPVTSSASVEPASYDSSSSAVSDKSHSAPEVHQGHHSSSGSSSSSSGSSSSSFSGSGEGVDTPFPDGELSCDEFPSSYGAIAVPWLGHNGWTGIQSPSSSLGGFSNIVTALAGDGCTEGAYCSYACPPGYQKSQWPTTQGATGQSIGGIQCKGGKLHLTNTAMSNKLCMEGDTNVKVQVQNKMNSQTAVCRTDYPGTESETVPLDAQPGSSSPLTCPDADNYYLWQGSHTSAQYYVNPAGTSVEDGCTWGSEGNPVGNYAPMNLGVGYSAGAAWLSIFQNAPTTDAKLDFDVEIIMEGEGSSGTCKYTASTGQYCGGADYDDCSSTTGCTVSLTSGTATFVFSN